MKNTLMRFFILLALLTPQLLSPTNSLAGEGASVGQLFIDAYTAGKKDEMAAVIEKHKKDVPLEVQSIVSYSLSDKVESDDEREFLLMIAGKMATIYKEKTGDGRLLAAVEANIKQIMKKEKKPGETKLPIIKEELTLLGKGEWNVRTILFDNDGKLKVAIILKEKKAGFTDRYVSFKDSKKAEEIVKKHIPNVKGRIDWFSGGMGMKAIILE